MVEIEGRWDSWIRLTCRIVIRFKIQSQRLHFFLQFLLVLLVEITLELSIRKDFSKNVEKAFFNRKLWFIEEKKSELDCRIITYQESIQSSTRKNNSDIELISHFLKSWIKTIPYFSNIRIRNNVDSRLMIIPEPNILWDQFSVIAFRICGWKAQKRKA